MSKKNKRESLIGKTVTTGRKVLSVLFEEKDTLTFNVVSNCKDNVLISASEVTLKLTEEDTKVGFVKGDIITIDKDFTIVEEKLQENVAKSTRGSSPSRRDTKLFARY